MLYALLLRYPGMPEVLLTAPEIAEIISRTAQEVFGQPSVRYSPTLVFRDIPGFDSVLAIQFILAMESTCGITLGEEDVDTMHTMGDLMTMVLAKKVSA